MRKPRRRGISSATAGIVAVVLTALLPVEAAHAQAPSLELAVKATYLYKLAPFIDWPGDAFASPIAPLVICVVGRTPLAEIADRAVTGQSVDGRPLEVRHLATVEPGRGCHIAYLGELGDHPARQSLEALAGEPVLTVTDSTYRPDARGIVHFVIREGRVRFAIDDFAAAAHRLEISAKVMDLAVEVRHRERAAR